MRRYYIIPFVVPVFPRSVGVTHFGMSLDDLLRHAAADADGATLTVSLKLCCDGQVVQQEEISARCLTDTKVDPGFFSRVYKLDRLGFLEFSVSADRPIIRRSKVEFGYALLERIDGGFVTLNPSQKYSEPIIVRQIEGIGRFCLVHQAHHVDIKAGHGNSVLIINSYDASLVARAHTKTGARLSRKVPARTAALIDLSEILEDGAWTCVIYEGSNRYSAWDVRHPYGEPTLVDSVDHTEYFRADPLYRRMSARAWVIQRITSGLRQIGLRY
jgi:hypothetical protein